MRLLALSPLLTVLMLLTACANAPRVPNAIHAELVEPYRLDAGDQVRVIVFGQTDLSNTYVIDQAGTIAMPLVGSIAARGQTTAELQVAIAGRLRSGFLRNPDVSVEVDRYRPFFVMGEVSAAGQYAFVPGITVQQAIAVAGGFSPRADMNAVQVTRSYGGHVGTDRLKLSDPIMPGDTLFVRERLL